MSRALPPGGGGTGLALAGGGPVGAIYEIGALRALEEALDTVDFTRLTCYVGVSAGALLAACLANGMSPELLMRIAEGEAADEEPFDPEVALSPNYGEFARRGAALPRVIMQALWQLTRRGQDRTLMATLRRATKLLPLGIFTNTALQEHLACVFDRPGRTDSFVDLQANLTVVAADLESGRPVRFSPSENAHVPISRAVQASSALPGVYPPVSIDGRFCVDGVLLKTLHASVALEQGVELLICINPIVPVDTAPGEASGELPPDALLQQGLTGVLSQTFRTLVHSRLEVGMAGYAERYPAADVVLFEPDRDAYTMFFGNLFSLESRRETCELAYEMTLDDLKRRYDELAPIFRRHGIRIRDDVLGRKGKTGASSRSKSPRPRRIPPRPKTAKP